MYREIFKTLETKKEEITYKEFLRYYKYAIKLNEKELYEFLSSIIPYDLKNNDEEIFYEIQGVINYKLKYNHYMHI